MEQLQEIESLYTLWYTDIGYLLLFSVKDRRSQPVLLQTLLHNRNRRQWSARDYLIWLTCNLTSMTRMTEFSNISFQSRPKKMLENTMVSFCYPPNVQKVSVHELKTIHKNDTCLELPLDIYIYILIYPNPLQP